MARYQRPVLNLQASDVWAAACAAQRINGAYLKTIEEGKNTETNRQIVDNFLKNTDLITDTDREQGEEVRAYYKGFTFKILQGKALNDFDNTAMVIANRDLIESNYDLAVITSLPASYARAVARDQVNNKIEFASGGFLGSVGEKVSVNIEVLRSVFSVQWGVFFITGITEQDQVVFFSYKNGVDVGEKLRVMGTIKAHRDRSTQLNRAKIL